MGHLHTKTMNRLQSALLEHDFVIQYKKGEIMPADYLSRLPSADPNHLADITQCFDPFQPELIDLQKADPDLQKMNHFRTKGEFLDNRRFNGHAFDLFQRAQRFLPSGALLDWWASLSWCGGSWPS